MRWTRYALYYTPPPGPLAAAGADWLGWSIDEGAARVQPALPLPRPGEAITEAPRRYGFHATLKPPFRLAGGRQPEELEAGARALCARLPPVRLAGLRLAALGPFLALVPEGETGPLGALAGALVEGLDSFRAPPAEADLARRRVSGLSARQEELLQRWGYPYVFEEFAFHMTLTGPLPEEERDAVASTLRTLFAPHLGPLTIDEITLAGEDEAGRFHSLARLPLAEAAG
ncbi:DUF1045 domain-containing protein [Pseudoroseicyclus tamaricis]|uniref:DUF1045 domain-containing protein n=1 Tax=Pseudoroseicyclus tamaricis TaxID=2705421 RepID=A0A6B2JYE6_9RHOB|nr:DUF1045 domain-containing protein [Pseudoroseicyclus tamaricis]NDV01324.1 DUF1045 domain-containing protein [Pseudoroseicyclus tamaricis]